MCPICVCNSFNNIPHIFCPKKYSSVAIHRIDVVGIDMGWDEKLVYAEDLTSIPLDLSLHFTPDFPIGKANK